MTDQATFDNYCIVELFGHQKIVGKKVTEQVIAGQGFIRVDVPKTKRRPAFTRMFGSGAHAVIFASSYEMLDALIEVQEIAANMIEADERERILSALSVAFGKIYQEAA